MKSSRYTNDRPPTVSLVRPEGKHGQTAEELYKALHELRIYQIELEMQNEELRDARERLEESRTMYAELYDSAPIGYVTLTASGCIRESNLTAAQMLCYDRSRLAGRPFAAFVARRDVPAFFRHLRQCASREQATTELRLSLAENIVWVQLTSSAVRDPELSYRTAIVDISERKRADHEHRRALSAEKELAGHTLREEREQNRLAGDRARVKSDDLRYQLETRTGELAQAQDTLRTEREHNRLESETARIRSEGLEHQLETRTGELARMALQFVERYEWIAALEKKLKQALVSSPSLSKKLLREALRSLRERLVEQDSWNIFEQQLGESSQQFLHTIAAAYPLLTPAELKICCLLRLNLSTKDIARLFYTSRKTIENQRYRIRKKLGLSAGDNLTVFLLSLSGDDLPQ